MSFRTLNEFHVLYFFLFKLISFRYCIWHPFYFSVFYVSVLRSFFLIKTFKSLMRLLFTFTSTNSVSFFLSKSLIDLLFYFLLIIYCLFACFFLFLYSFFVNNFPSKMLQLSPFCIFLLYFRVFCVRSLFFLSNLLITLRFFAVYYLFYFFFPHSLLLFSIVC